MQRGLRKRLRSLISVCEGLGVLQEGTVLGVLLLRWLMSSMRLFLIGISAEFKDILY